MKYGTYTFCVTKCQSDVSRNQRVHKRASLFKTFWVNDILSKAAATLKLKRLGIFEIERRGIFPGRRPFPALEKQKWWRRRGRVKICFFRGFSRFSAGLTPCFPSDSTVRLSLATASFSPDVIRRPFWETRVRFSRGNSDTRRKSARFWSY